MENTEPPAVDAASEPASSAPPTHVPLNRQAVVWFGAASLFNLVAAIAALSHDGRAGLRWGTLSLVAVLVGACLHQRDKRSGTGAFVARMSPAVISLAGSALLLGAFAGVASWTTRRWRGFDLWGTDGFYLRNDQVVHMALALALAFLGLALWQRAARPGRRPRTGLRVGSAVLLVLLFGPELGAENNVGGDAYPAVFVKRSVVDAWREPVSDAVLLRREAGTEATDPPGAPRVCAVLARHARFLLAWQTPLGDEPRESACGEQARAALESGLAVEAELLHGEVDRYFARVHVDPALRDKPVALDVDQLPADLQQPLAALLTLPAHGDFTPFDLALATRRKDDATALMPEAASLRPHQRQGLFDLGMADPVGVADPTQAETSRQRKVEALQEHLQALLLAGQLGMDASTLRWMGASALLGLQRDEAPTPGLGPFSPADYMMANRRCDVGYAGYLRARGVLPTWAQALHLTSLIGRAQYPGISSEFGKSFPSADDSLGLPDAGQLAHCVDLARFYAREVQDWAPDDPGVAIDESPLGRLYLDAAAAAEQWYFRDAETWRKAHGLWPRVQDTTVVGEPEIAVEAAHAMIAAQPLSFEQYCMWSNTWYTWRLQTKQQRPGLTRAMQALAASWRTAKPVPRSPQASCRLVGLPWKTNEYDDMRQGLALLNADLRRLGMPCQWGGNASDGGSLSLNCRMPVAP